MIVNYIKSALRKITRSKLFSLIIIVGLLPGIICSFFIYSWILDELSFDKYHKNFNNIYRVIIETEVQNVVEKGISTPYPVGNALKDNVEEITHNTCFRSDEFTISYKDHVYNETGFATVDPDFFTIFSFSFITGDPKSALINPYTVVLTERVALKYFKNENPIGKTLTVNHKYEFLVTGIIKNPPENSDFQFNFAANNPFNEGPGPSTSKPWGACMCRTYILTHENADISTLENRIGNIIQKYDPETIYKLRLEPLSNIHLYRINGNNEPIVYLYIFLITGLLILFISSINYVNIFIASMLSRIHDISVKRILGAKRKNLVYQILIESAIYILIALIFSAIIIELIRPYFNELVHKNLEFNYSSLSFASFFIIVFLLIEIMAGLYPALLFSSKRIEKFNQNNILSNFSVKSKKVLVIVQYVISISLIISTIFISKQLRFILNKDLGFCKENIIYFKTNQPVRNHIDVFKQDALNIPGIASVSICNNLPFFISNSAGNLDWEGHDPVNEVTFSFSRIDCDYLNTFEIPIIAGRNFRSDLTTDYQNFILNKEAVKRMGIENPIGLKFRMWGHEGKVIGVVNNFYSDHFEYEIQPVVLSQNLGGLNYIAIKVQPKNIHKTIEKLREVWREFAPDYPFEYQYMSDAFNNMYKKESLLVQLFFIFSVITIFISCLGLFGISSIIIDQRTKEVGIRKVLGASNGNIFGLLYKKFAGWVIIAFLFACPIAYLFIKNLLHQYQYRISLSFWPFIIAGILSVILALISIIIFAIRATKRNPVESLRYE